MEKSLDNKSVFQALPTELLVHIFTFLLSRDKVNLRYVSRRIRYATETASLWSEFVWPYYDRRGENSVKNLLKSCGGYIKTLTFPNHVPPVNTLQCCNNVVELSIPQAKLDPEQLGNVVKHMGGLKKLDVKWTDADMMPLLSISSKLNQLTVRLTPKGEEDDSLEELLDSFLHNWAVKGCIPHYVNIVYFCFQQLPIDEWIFCSTHNWSHISSGGHTGLLKVYYNLKVPLDLYTVLPAFQLQFGCAAAPFRLVDGRMVGLVSPVVLFEDGSVAGSGFSWLCLTDCSYGGKIAFKAEFCSFRNADGIPIDENTKNLNFVTYLKVSCGWLRPDHLEQLAVTCTNLQNLLLDNSSSCLRNLQGLRAIASYCHSLQGLNLVGICATEVEDCMQLWEILSDLKLTHLGIQLCNILSFEDNDVSKRKVFNLYSKFAFLKALQFGVSGFNRTCPKCENVSSQDIFLLSYLPSLTYCALDLRSTRASDTMIFQLHYHSQKSSVRKICNSYLYV
ncbi:uncharacterized protein [Dysidea avara]|uniref:uncharacterized protein n=1 Tax=Dysidea avara TaxID=196820 RepID=UPI0033311B20